jgi:hypothetical protein
MEIQANKRINLSNVSLLGQPFGELNHVMKLQKPSENRSAFSGMYRSYVLYKTLMPL